MNLINIIKEEYKNILKEEEDYRTDHRAPYNSDTSSPLYNVKNTFGNDFYELGYKKAANYYGSGYKYDLKLAEIIYNYKDNPDKEIEIYRAIPNSEDIEHKINPGDWVSIIKEYAVDHGKRQFDNNYIILSKKVKASEVFTEGYMEEWGYDPTGSSKPINEDYENNDIKSNYENIDRDPSSIYSINLINNLKSQFNHDYIPKEIRLKNDLNIIDKEINKKYTVTTNKGLPISFKTEKYNNNKGRASIYIEIYNSYNDIIGFCVFYIESFYDRIIIEDAEVIKQYRRKGIYTKIVDYIESIADKYNLKIVEGSRSKDAREFWQNRLNNITNK